MENKLAHKLDEIESAKNLIQNLDILIEEADNKNIYIGGTNIDYRYFESEFWYSFRSFLNLERNKTEDKLKKSLNL